MSGPVLLMGAGSGLATSGLLYLASYLRRHGVEAYARPFDSAPSLSELERRTHALLELTRPSLVGISLKWFLHLHRGLFIAKVIKEHDPSIRVVLGGDTASHYYRELLEFDCVDHVVRGDGEAPLLAIVQGHPHPNAWTRARAATSLVGLQGLYTQTRDDDDSSLSELDSIFLCEADRYFVPPFVVGGKGCSQGCLYCGGARTAQATNFGRRKSFMRPVDAVRRDIQALLPRAYTLVYDFSDHPLHDPVTGLAALWEGLDLSKSGILYYAWRVPPPEFVALLSATHESVTLGLDFGCFSERQRSALIGAHLLKPLPEDRAFLDVIEHAAQYPNVRVRVSGVSGLPFLEAEDLDRERALISTLAAYPQVEDILFDRVHAQPGAPMLAELEAYGMRSPVRDFRDFLGWSREHAPNGEYRPPVLAHVSDPGALPNAVFEREIALTEHHRETRAQIDVALAARARDPARLSTLADLSGRSFVRATRSRVLNRYRPREWWLEFERPPIPDAELDIEMARVIIGHVWQKEFGAVSVPALLVDWVLAEFERPTTAEAALRRIVARGGALDADNLLPVLRHFYEHGILDEQS